MTVTTFDASQLDEVTRFRYDNLVDALRAHEREGTLDSSLATKLQSMKDAIENGAAIDPAAKQAVRPEEGTRKRGGARGANQYGAYKVRSASPAQIRYIARLLNEVEVPANPRKVFADALAAYHTNPSELALRVASDLIDWLNNLPTRKGETPGRPAERMATEKQVAAIIREGQRRVFDDLTTMAAVNSAGQDQPVTFADARHALDVLFAAPFKPRDTKREAATEGMYRKDGVIYKVQIAHHGSKRPYAKKLVVDFDDVTDETEIYWDRAPGMVNVLTEADKLSLDEAKAFGKLYGVCVCSRILTDEKSIEAGIGPICAGKF